jgi:hypothetical protein
VKDQKHPPGKKEKRLFVLRQLTAMTARCRITTLELRSCAITGPHAEWLVGGVLAQCRALVHLDLSENLFGSDGAESFAGVLGQCLSLAHLNLSRNRIGDAGAKSLAGVLSQCPALAHLLCKTGAEILAGVLAQCAALAHLDLVMDTLSPEVNIGTDLLPHWIAGPQSPP